MTTEQNVIVNKLDVHKYNVTLTIGTQTIRYKQPASVSKYAYTKVISEY